jgi:hypothetical protein
VVFRSDDGQLRRVVLVFPGQADIGEGKISILTPIGTVLIGLSVGQSIAWLTRDGKSRRLTVVSVEGTTNAAVPGSATAGQPRDKELRAGSAGKPEGASVLAGDQTTGFREAVAVFDTAEALQSAIDELLSSGFHRSQLSLLAGEAEVVAKLGHKYRRSSELADEASVPRAAYVSTEAIGDGEGAVIGALMYVGAGVLMGPVAAAGGTIAAILGAAALGSGAGGVIGTVLARLLGDWHAHRIAEQLDHGGMLLWVRPGMRGRRISRCRSSSAMRVATFTSISMGISHDPEARCERCCRQGFGRGQDLQGRRSRRLELGSRSRERQDHQGAHPQCGLERLRPPRKRARSAV